MQYKRILMSCLIVILILSASMLCIGATEEAPEFKIAVDVNASTAVTDNDSIVLKPGDTFEVSISIDTNPSFVAMDLKVDYDDAAVSLLEVETSTDVISDKNEFDIDTTTKGVVKIKNKTWTTPITANGKIVTLKFKVNSGAHSTSPVVTVARVIFMDANSNYVRFDDPTEQKIYVHDLESEYTVDQEATCTALGSKSLHCKKCDAKAGKTAIEMIDHTYGEWTVATAPTCTETGSETATCAKCGFVEEKELGALGHTYGDEWLYTDDANKPTCVKSGKGYKVCTVCEAQSEEQIVDALGHQYGEWVVEAEATCDAKGMKSATCTVCQDKKTEVIDALGHEYSAEWTVDVEPICKVSGSKSRHCIRCTAKTDVTAIDALEHEFTEWTVVKAATCTKAGVEKRTCSKCNTIEEERAIDALGHKYSTEWTIDVPATCLKAGEKSYHCENCGDRKDVTVIPAGEHTYGEWTVVTAATCTLSGTEKRTCTACNIAEETRTVEATGHNYSTEWTVEEEATCTTAGVKAQYCACGEKTNVTEIEALGHNFTDWETVDEATCTESGSETRSCKRKGCGEEEVRVIGALGHTAVPYPEVAATEKNTGYTGGTYCSVCEETLTERTIIPKIVNLGWLYIVLAVVVVVCVGGGAYAYYFFAIKKKKQTADVSDDN